MHSTISVLDAVKLQLAQALLRGPGTLAPQLGAVTLLPHQRSAAGRLLGALQGWGGALLLDPVGTGKTYTALACTQGISPITVVAPAVLRGMWTRALRETGVTATLRSTESLGRSRRSTSPSASGGLVIVDEAHHFRNPRTRRYDALARLTLGQRILLLTATPVHNAERDLRALLELFLSLPADAVVAELLPHLAVRRTDAAAHTLPMAAPIEWKHVDGDRAVLDALLALPSPLPARDSGTAHALNLLGLLRQWSSSDAALRSAVDRRIAFGEAMRAQLEQGVVPDRHNIQRWIADTHTIQLGLPLDIPDVKSDAAPLHRRMIPYLEALRALRALLACTSTDASRLGAILSVLEMHSGSRTVLFTHSRDTATAIWKSLLPHRRCALLTGSGARIASGRISRDEVLQQFAPRAKASAALTLDLLIASDVVSEGVDLHAANVLIHLDLPWTVARLEQRLGRLRRVNASHDRIYQYALAPLQEPERLVRVIQRLRRKAGISETVLGPDPLALVPRPRRLYSHASPLPASELVRHRAQHWQINEADVARDLPIVGVRGSADDAELLAVADAGDGPEVLVRNAGGVSQRQDHLAAACDAIDRGHTTAVPDRTRARCLGAVRRWAEQEHLRRSLCLTGYGVTHRKVLQRLRSALGRLSRAERSTTAQLLSGLDAVLRRSAGAGAERVMTDWLSQESANPLDGARQLLSMLESRARPTSFRSAPRVLALVVFRVD